MRQTIHLTEEDLREAVVKHLAAHGVAGVDPKDILFDRTDNGFGGAPSRTTADVVIEMKSKPAGPTHRNDGVIHNRIIKSDLNRGVGEG